MKCNKIGSEHCNNACFPRRSKYFGNFTFQSSFFVLLSLILLGIFISSTMEHQGFLATIRSWQVIDVVFSAIEDFSYLPIVLLGVPFIGGIGQIIFAFKTCHRRDMLVIGSTFITILLVMFTYPQVKAGGIHIDFPKVLGLGISFHLDMLGFVMLLITSLIWFFVMVYAHEYMKKERHCDRFFLFISFTYGAVLGTILAGDLLTLFLFLEIMTFTSYMLVIHAQKEEAYQAGYNYIFMGILGGFAILVAILLLYFTVGDVSFSSAIAALTTHGAIKYWIFGLIVFGFGIKAGMAPVHIWLPRAHPVAPTPASALLSGIMIKVGAYGILRVGISYFFPTVGSVSDFTDPIWLPLQTIGSWIIWIGIITMAIGVFMALQQSHIKKMLAYHSISQMGYILMGIGVVLYLGYKGAMGYTGALYHIINHALFKSLLFMVAGVVYYHTKETNMYKLGGLWKKLPLTGTICLIACFGIAGMPLFNGFISKSILHHSIVEAHQYGHPTFFYAELIFMIINAGTVCSFIKLFYYVFLRKLPKEYESIKPEYNSLDTALIAVAIIIVLIGLNPRYILDTFIVPQLSTIAFDPVFVQKYVIPLEFFTGKELLTMLIVFILGGVLFIGGTKLHLFHIKLPKWLKIEYIIFFPINVVLRKLCIWMHGKECSLVPEEIERIKMRNVNMGFIDRFVYTSKLFSKKYETTIIQSDSLIYTVFITLILLFMIFMKIL